MPGVRVVAMSSSCRAEEHFRRELQNQASCGSFVPLSRQMAKSKTAMPKRVPIRQMTGQIVSE